MIKKIHHVAIAVPDIQVAQRFWVDALGLALGHTAQVPEEGVDVAFLEVGDSHVELLQPAAADTGVARFIEKRGPGIHHICLEVEDIDAMLAQLKAHRVRLINEEALAGRGRRYAFVHPQGTGGVLVELYQLVGGQS
jgi:methylmalonyl-CoA/ethylmalonyl-CoA epimerase